MSKAFSVDMKKVAALLADGASITQTAEAMGLKESTLRGHMNRAGIAPPNNHGEVAQQMAQARAMAAQRRSVREIAEALGIPVATAKWRMKRFGIATNPSRLGRRDCADPADCEPEDAPPPRVVRPVVEPSVDAFADLSPIDRELAATGGSYAALALVAARHKMTSLQARARWHKLGLSVTVVS